MTSNDNYLIMTRNMDPNRLSIPPRPRTPPLEYSRDNGVDNTSQSSDSVVCKKDFYTFASDTDYSLDPSDDPNKSDSFTKVRSISFETNNEKLGIID
jgi:hypothetical protein